MQYSISIDWKWWDDSDDSLIDLISIYGNGELLDCCLVPCVCFPFRIAVQESFWKHHASELYDIAGQLLCEI